MTEELKAKLKRWLNLLEQDGCNSKEQVEKEIKEELDRVDKKAYKLFRLEFKSKKYPTRKQRIHRTDNLHNSLMQLKGVITLYPENYLPFEVWSNIDNRILTVVETIIEFKQYLNQTKFL